MSIGLLFWILCILAVIAYFFGTAYPALTLGFLFLLICLLGWKAFGPPIHNSGSPP